MDFNSDNSITPNQLLRSQAKKIPEATEVSASTDSPRISAVVQNEENSGNSGKVAAETEQAQQEQDINAIVTDINEYTQNIQRDLKFSVAEESGRIVIQVFDTSTEELIRQIPSEEILAISEALQSDQTGGALLNVKT